MSFKRNKNSAYKGQRNLDKRNKHNLSTFDHYAILKEEQFQKIRTVTENPGQRNKRILQTFDHYAILKGSQIQQIRRVIETSIK